MSDILPLTLQPPTSPLLPTEQKDCFYGPPCRLASSARLAPGSPGLFSAQQGDTDRPDELNHPCSKDPFPDSLSPLRFCS